MMSRKMTGRDFIKMMRPILGLEKTPSIRRLKIHADAHDVTWCEVEVLPNVSPDAISVEEAHDQSEPPEVRKYIITVEPVSEVDE